MFGQLRGVANRNGADSQIHKNRGPLSGRTVTSAGLDVSLSVAAVFGINHRCGFQGGFDTFGANTDKGQAQLPVLVVWKLCGFQGVGAFNA